MQVEARIISSLSDSRTTERLSVFIDGRDPDGIDDLAWVVVEFPRDGLGWRLEGETLHYRQSDSRHWFGSDQLTVPGTSELPRGTLRIILGDLSGRTATREVTLPPGRAPEDRRSYPRLRRDSASRSVVLETVRVQSRHYLVSGERRLEVRFPESPSGTAPGSAPGVSGFELPQEALQPFANEPLWVIVEWSPSLWLEWGPWDHR